MLLGKGWQFGYRFEGEGWGMIIWKIIHISFLNWRPLHHFDNGQIYTQPKLDFFFLSKTEFLPKVHYTYSSVQQMLQEYLEVSKSCYLLPKKLK